MLAEKNRQENSIELFLTAALAVMLSLIIDIVLIVLFSSQPSLGIKSLIIGPFSSQLHFGRTLNNATLLVLSGLAMSLSFKGGYLNFGGEGQIYVGGFSSTLFWLTFPDLPSSLGITAGILVGGICGGLISGISGVLKAHLNVNEILSTYLISASAIFVTDAMLIGPFANPDTYLIATKTIPEQFWLQSWLPPSSFSGMWIPALVIALLLWIFFRYTKPGFRMKLARESMNPAQLKNMPVKRNTVLTLAGSGFIFGIAGAAAIASRHHQFIKGFSTGLGWNGISVSLIAGNNPLGILLSSFTLSALFQGTDLAALKTASGQRWVQVMQAVVLFLASAKLIIGKINARRQKNAHGNHF